MKRLPLLVAPLLIVFIFGCSSNPAEPNRTAQDYNPAFAPFQMAVYFVNPNIGAPYSIPTQVPFGLLVPQERFQTFSSYVLAIFNIYYEPCDWDDWLLNQNRTVSYEPNDWDDWLLGKNDVSSIFLRKANWDLSLSLQEIGRILDPHNLYEPDDWDDWLIYEPNDWDDWLLNHTIEDVASLGN